MKATSATIAINKKPIIKPVGAEDFFDSAPAEVLISPDKAGATDESSGTTEYSILKPLECSTASSLVNFIIIDRRVQLPVIIKFTSDEAVEHSSGFKIEYSVVPDDSSVAPALSGEIRTSAGAESKKSSAPTGLIIGFLLIAIVALVAFIVHKKRKQTKERGMDGMEMPTLTPTENVYEILDHSARDESVLLRTESQDSIAQEKLAAQNSMRELPDLPTENPYSETP
jgi:hypothetical protein